MLLFEFVFVVAVSVVPCNGCLLCAHVFVQSTLSYGYYAIEVLCIIIIITIMSALLPQPKASLSKQSMKARTFTGAAFHHKRADELLTFVNSRRSDRVLICHKTAGKLNRKRRDV